MTFKLDIDWDARNKTFIWSFAPQDSFADALLSRLGFHDIFKHHTPLSLHGMAAVATGKMLKACGASFQ